MISMHAKEENRSSHSIFISQNIEHYRPWLYKIMQGKDFWILMNDKGTKTEKGRE